MLGSLLARFRKPKGLRRRPASVRPSDSVVSTFPTPDSASMQQANSAQASAPKQSRFAALAASFQKKRTAGKAQPANRSKSATQPLKRKALYAGWFDAIKPAVVRHDPTKPIAFLFAGIGNEGLDDKAQPTRRWLMPDGSWKQPDEHTPKERLPDITVSFMPCDLAVRTSEKLSNKTLLSRFKQKVGTDNRLINQSAKGMAYATPVQSRAAVDGPLFSGPSLIEAALQQAIAKRSSEQALGLRHLVVVLFTSPSEQAYGGTTNAVFFERTPDELKRIECHTGIETPVPALQTYAEKTVVGLTSSSELDSTQILEVDFGSSHGISAALLDALRQARPYPAEAELANRPVTAWWRLTAFVSACACVAGLATFAGLQLYLKNIKAATAKTEAKLSTIDASIAEVARKHAIGFAQITSLDVPELFIKGKALAHPRSALTMKATREKATFSLDMPLDQHVAGFEHLQTRSAVAKVAGCTLNAPTLTSNFKQVTLTYECALNRSDMSRLVSSN